MGRTFWTASKKLQSNLIRKLWNKFLKQKINEKMDATLLEVVQGALWWSHHKNIVGKSSRSITAYGVLRIRKIKGMGDFASFSLNI